MAKIMPVDVLDHETAVGRAATRPTRRSNLPPYEVLDPILDYVEDDRTAGEIIELGHERRWCDASLGSST